MGAIRRVAKNGLGEPSVGSILGGSKDNSNCDEQMGFLLNASRPTSKLASLHLGGFKAQ